MSPAKGHAFNSRSIFFHHRNIFNLMFHNKTMPRPTEFHDPEYDRQLAEFKARKAAAKAEQERSGEQPAKKKVTENTWISVNKQ
jgi:hypothetical protein